MTPAEHELHTKQHCQMLEGIVNIITALEGSVRDLIEAGKAQSLINKESAEIDIEIAEILGGQDSKLKADSYSFKLITTLLDNYNKRISVLESGLPNNKPTSAKPTEAREEAVKCAS